MSSSGHSFSPEARLPMSLVGCLAIPIGLFWFAWTNSPSSHLLISIAAQILFGFGFVLVYISIQNYLVDAYIIYSASVLAANAMLRSVFDVAFPLFSELPMRALHSILSPDKSTGRRHLVMTGMCDVKQYMYQGLGIHWVSCIPGFLALACVPFPFVFYRYGERLRKNCRFAAEAAKCTRELGQR